MSERKKAAALKYEANMDAPIVTAAGVGKIAEKIIEEAEANFVPTVENKELAELLTNVECGEEIPTELYDVVANILAYVMELDEKVEGDK